MRKSIEGDRPLSPNDVVRAALSTDVTSSGNDEEPKVTQVLHVLDARGTTREVSFLGQLPQKIILGEE